MWFHYPFQLIFKILKNYTDTIWPINLATDNFWFDSSTVPSVKTVCTIRTLIFLQWGIKIGTEKYSVWQLSHCIPQIAQILFRHRTRLCVTLKSFGCVHAVDMITPTSIPFLPPVWVKTVPLKPAPHRLIPLERCIPQLIFSILDVSH